MMRNTTPRFQSTHHQYLGCQSTTLRNMFWTTTIEQKTQKWTNTMVMIHKRTRFLPKELA
ncbi:unnamed protein product [Ixodes persulcatus]